jgi:hypothetical protein
VGTTESRIIEFMLNVQLDNVFFNPAKPDGIAFAIGEQHNLRLRLAPKDPKQDSFGHRYGLTCEVYARVPANLKQREFVSALLDGRFTSYQGMPIRLPHVQHSTEQIDSEGAIREGYGVPFEYYPPDLQQLCDTVSKDLFDAAARFVKLLIWQQDVDSPHWPFTSHHLYWRVTEGMYHLIGLRGQASQVRHPVGFMWDAQDQTEFFELWHSGASEPLAHELLREARSLVLNSPRSALLTLASALETGVKSHIARQVPKTAWLLEKLSAPPIDRLLREYIPQLHDSEKIEFWTKLSSLFKTAEKMAKDRNALTHSGKMLVKYDKLKKYFGMVSDILYILDFLDGHTWAMGNVQTETRKLLGWPPPRHKRFLIRVLDNR